MAAAYFPTTNRWQVTFVRLPANEAELRALPEAAMDEPWKTAALTAAALCAWPREPNDTIGMINFLRGPRPLSPYDVQFMRDRLRDKLYLPRAYFAGATPENDYTPTQPYTVTVMETVHSNDNRGDGYVTLYLACGGADNPRPVQLRVKPSTGQWFLWEQMLMVGIRIPRSADPWA